MSKTIISCICKNALDRALYSSLLSPLCVIDPNVEFRVTCKYPEFTSGLNVASLLSKLSTCSLGRTLLYGDCIPSTQDIALKYFGEMKESVVLVAHSQSKGKGRGINTWEAPVGSMCVTVAMSLCLSSLASLPFVQYLAALDVVKAIRSMANVNVQIKWPNDIFYGHDKIGGVLCQSTQQGQSLRLFIGIGLNIDNQHPTTCLNSILKNTTDKMDVESAIAAFLNIFERDAALFSACGFNPFFDEYYQYWMHNEQKIVINDVNINAKITGISDSGFLKAKDYDGKEYELHPDGNSFDMMSNMIVRKSV